MRVGLKLFSNLLSLSIWVAFLFIFASCNKDEIDDIGTKLPEELNRTVLVYMDGDNSLSSFCSQNMESIVLGMKNVKAKANILVYVDNYVGKPTIWEIKNNPATNQVEQHAVKIYAEQNSASVEVMAQVINDAFQLYPAEHKGLILWSHATGWVPSPSYQPSSNEIAPFSFGDDNGSYLEIWELREALEKGPFLDFIIFDACHMASVEAFYELRNVTDHIIASVTEIMGVGFPYQTMVPLFHQDQLDYTRICQAYMNYYKGGWGYDGAISLIKTSELPALADQFALLRQRNLSSLASITYSSIQQFGRSPYKNVFFDLEHVVEAISSEVELAEFKAHLNQCVLYKNSTSSFFDVIINRNSGVSVYLPDAIANERYRSAYRELQWSKTIGY